MQDRFLGRRHVLASAAISALAAGTSSLDGQDDGARSTPKVCVYTEHFQSLPIPEVCRLFAEMGVDGLDLTVRPGGHIKPAEVKAQLPLAARAARDHGLKVMMLTTGITGPGRLPRRRWRPASGRGSTGSSLVTTGSVSLAAWPGGWPRCVSSLNR